MGRIFLVTLLAAGALAGCETRDIRAEQMAECAAQNGVYHPGQEPDDDVCVMDRGRIINFDDREVEEE